VPQPLVRASQAVRSGPTLGIGQAIEPGRNLIDPDRRVAYEGLQVHGILR
jgi:hypothetical protein